MEIKCLRCKQEFDVSKEQIRKIKEIVIGKTFKPEDYLWVLPNFSTMCSSGKGHDFVFTDKFSDEKKRIIHEYDESHKSIVELKRELGDINGMNEKLSQEREQINKRLEEIRDTEFANGQKINDISLTKIPEKESLIVKTLDSFEELIGTRDIELWKDVVIPKTTVTVPEVTKKEDKK